MGESKEFWLKKNQLCVYSKKWFKDNDKPAHWVGHSKLRSLDIDELFKIKQKFDENQASVTGNIEGEGDAAEKTNDDADENSEANQINDKIRTKLLQ